MYAEGVNGEERRSSARELLGRLLDRAALPPQVLGELYSVLVGKGKWRPTQARDAVQQWRTTFPLLASSGQSILAAVDLACDHHLAIWDAAILAVASHAQCEILLSEDLKHGFSWGGVVVVNPFTSPRPWLLDLLLEGT